MAFSVVAQRPLRSLKFWRNFWDREEFRMFGLHLNWLLSFSSLSGRFYLFLPKLQCLWSAVFWLQAAGSFSDRSGLQVPAQPQVRSCWVYFILVSVLVCVCVCPVSHPCVFPCISASLHWWWGGCHQMQRFRWRLEGKLRPETFLVVSSLQFSWFT